MILKKKDDPHRLCIFEMRDCEKMWLVKCLKSLLSEHLPTVNMLNSLKTCTAAAVRSYCFITLAKIEFDNATMPVLVYLKSLEFWLTH